MCDVRLLGLKPKELKDVVAFVAQA